MSTTRSSHFSSSRLFAKQKFEEDNSTMPEDGSVSSSGGEISSSNESGSGMSSSGTGTGSGKDASSQSSSSFELARAETRAVNRSKLLVLLVIMIAAAVLGTLVWYLLDQEEIMNFESEFRTFSLEVAELVHFEAKSVFTAIDAMSTAITSLALRTAMEFPNATIPHFEVRGFKSNDLSKATQISYVPLVNDKEQWSQYVAANKGWFDESMKMQAELAALHKDEGEDHRRLAEGVAVSEIPLNLWRRAESTGTNESGAYFGPGKFGPVWQQAPAPADPASIINFDLFSLEPFARVYHGMWESRLPVLSEVMNLEWLYGSAVKDDSEHPHSFLMSPVYPSLKAGLHESDDLAGLLLAVVDWDHYFANLLVEGTNGIVVVLHDTCGDHFTYELHGPKAVFIGEGDLHDHAYNHLEFDTEFAPFLHHNFSETLEHCEYDLRIFPSATLESAYRTERPGIYTAVVVLVFFFTAMVFVLYDYLVQRRQEKVMATAKRTNAIVSSLFPKNVRDRIMKDAAEQAEQDLKDNKKSIFGMGDRAGAKTKLKAFLDEELEGETKPGGELDSKPIADLFPEVTIMFADIVGFTAWSSVREPAQVFTLLETLFAAFDEIASRRRVFKVETVGDCYVAVAGLPDPRKDHAVVMARFARDVLYRMNSLTKRLEVSLGPDTGDLSLRIGLHSGQVTAGVLRGDKSRFQLFGDAMNTTARIETTGERNKIHVSAETAGLLMTAGKTHWIKEREDTVEAKGKGELKTFWLDLRSQSSPSAHSGGSSSGDDMSNAEGDKSSAPVETLTAGVVTSNDDAIRNAIAAKTTRLIEWNVDVLARLLKEIKVRRKAQGTDKIKFKDPEDVFEGGAKIINEVKEIIKLPRYEGSLKDAKSVELDYDIVEQLRDYVSTIASLYRDNPFHNFEHASHVTMSVVKLLSRIVAPDDVVDRKEGDIGAALHDHTYGITSDPLTQFSCIFSALIHDVDHNGVPNNTLIAENAAVAAAYGNKSVAEQNSVDIAWGLLMAPEYEALRGAIYIDESEMKRFRQLLVNSLMATDIMDKDASKFRKARWEKAFSENANSTDSELDSINRKATIVIEHLIQASDVSHTMQHWHIYSKWNERLFDEMYKAYKEGRAEKDPSENWYQGEIGFFDFYVIPLAMKLKTCGVFGVASDEYLNYATNNRREWEARGKDRVEQMLAKYRDD